MYGCINNRYNRRRPGGPGVVGGGGKGGGGRGRRDVWAKGRGNGGAEWRGPDVRGAWGRRDGDANGLGIIHVALWVTIFY